MRSGRVCCEGADTIPGAAAGRRFEDHAEVRCAARTDGGHRRGIVERWGGQQAPVLADTSDFRGERGSGSSGGVHGDLDGTEPEGSAATAGGDRAAEQRARLARSASTAHGEGSEFAGCDREIRLCNAQYPACAIGRFAQEDGEGGRTGCAVPEATTGGYAKAAEVAGE